MPDSTWMHTPLVLKGSFDVSSSGGNSFATMQTVSAVNGDYNIGHSTESARLSLQVIGTGAALAGVSETGERFSSQHLLRASTEGVRSIGYTELDTVTEAGRISVRTKDIINGKFNNDVSPWFGHVSFVRPQVTI